MVNVYILKYKAMNDVKLHKPEFLYFYSYGALNIVG